MKFEPNTNKTTLLLDNLRFPNGIALSENRDFLLFVETTTCKLFKYWLKTPRIGELEVMTQFHGFPDNIKRIKSGGFWVGINSRRGKLLDWIISNPSIGKFVVEWSPFDCTRIHLYMARLIGRLGMGIRLDRDGNVVDVLDLSKGMKWKLVSEVEEHNGYLWVGSVTRSFAIKERVPKHH
ncbi:Protein STRICTOSIDINE SYNTHASE-LIKE 2 [Striga hermonthica]|uniref:Protein STRICTOSIDINE SYNTHASE-LIKE 2 n=1 Tax=Striga hermonthica TaxID=68872 RepID=A0A9N7MQC1_STRHE|nr:Protein STRICTOSIDINE SYNTHASE-LIKE 2 [Striga hermonthica]